MYKNNKFHKNVKFGQYGNENYLINRAEKVTNKFLCKIN